MKIIDFGIKDYGEVLEEQTKLFDVLVNKKKGGTGGEEAILIGEHYPVITLGRRAQEANILFSHDYLDSKGIKTFKIGRGGDVTYHCPGQLIVYPIINLEAHSLSVKGYMELLEESVILLLRKYGIIGERVEGATGVWIGKGSENERKICAMGIKCNRYCSMHGLALNVSSDLQGFSMINPCGFKDKGVTSMELELGEKGVCLDIKKIKKDFLHIFLSLVFPFEEILDFTE